MTDEPDNKAGNDLTPEQKAEAARELKKLLQGVEDDEEIFYYLAPFREETEGDDEVTLTLAWALSNSLRM